MKRNNQVQVLGWWWLVGPAVLYVLLAALAIL